MTDITIRNVLLDGQRVDIDIEGGLVADIVAPRPLPVQAHHTIDGSHMAALPGFVNGHTHAAMTLLRGYGDDMPLEAWLKEKIWPAEARWTDEGIYWAARLACLEMIKSGTTCFNDMYFRNPATARAVVDSGLRAVLGEVAMDFFDPQQTEAVQDRFRKWERNLGSMAHPRLRFAVAPHALYTVSEPLLRWLGDFARDHDMLLHIHAAETETECHESLERCGQTPLRRLHTLGLLGPRTVVAHALWLDDDEIRMAGDTSTGVVHNPNSNLKLGSGFRFRLLELRDAGARIGLGTDGCSSSNNLDMLEAAKTMALLQKGWRHDPTALPAAEALSIASAGGAALLGLDLGTLAPGRPTSCSSASPARPSPPTPTASPTYSIPPTATP